MRIDMRIGMNIDMCIDMCINMCADMCACTTDLPMSLKTVICVAKWASAGLCDLHFRHNQYDSNGQTCGYAMCRGTVGKHPPVDDGL